jgi:hypothetical protein
MVVRASFDFVDCRWADRASCGDREKTVKVELLAGITTTPVHNQVMEIARGNCKHDEHSLTYSRFDEPSMLKFQSSVKRDASKDTRRRGDAPRQTTIGNAINEQNSQWNRGITMSWLKPAWSLPLIPTRADADGTIMKRTVSSHLMIKAPLSGMQYGSLRSTICLSVPAQLDDALYMVIVSWAADIAASATRSNAVAR